MIILLRCNVWWWSKHTFHHEGTRYSHGIRTYAPDNVMTILLATHGKTILYYIIEFSTLILLTMCSHFCWHPCYVTLTVLMIQKTWLSHNTWASPRGGNRNNFVIISLDMLVRFPLNHKFKTHSSYSTKKWTLIMKMWINNKIIASRHISFTYIYIAHLVRLHIPPPPIWCQTHEN
jgi:hypothetical protein